MIGLDRDGDVFVLRWDDGGDNRFHATSVAALHAGLDQVEEAGPPAALVLTGAGKFFSNGLDLDWMASDDCADPQGFLADMIGLLGRVLTFPAVTVAAVNGHAFASGAMLALAHDHVVMREDRGYWCVPEVDLGMRFAPGMNDLLAAKLPPATANQALTRAHRFSGPEAVAAGIAHETASEADVVAVAVAFAAQHAGRAGPVLGAVKRDLYATAAASCRRGDPPPPLDQ